MSAQRLILIAPWFGPWPVWINLYLESCRWNPDIAWLIPTDQDPPENRPPNVTFLKMGFDAIIARAQAVAGTLITAPDAYKLTDLKPLLGAMFETEISDFSHFGYTDLDIIYGQLNCEFTPERLDQYEVISSHSNMQSGHLSIFQNSQRMRTEWRRVRGWRRAISSPEHQSFDERSFSRRLDPRKWQPPWRRYKVLWHEMYSMPDRRQVWLDGGPPPTRMIWKQGRLTEPRNAQPQYAYLHFMLWRSNRYRYTNRVGMAPWPERDEIMHVKDWREAAEQGFEISHDGFTLIRSNSDVT